MRFAAIRNGLPPYQFCDETIYAGEVLRMLRDGDWLANEFRAGGFNIYPVYLTLKPVVGVLGTVPDLYELTTGGRILMGVLVGAATVFPLYFGVRRLFRDSVAAAAAVLLFAVSPFVYANSQIWYPDTYSCFSTACILYFASRLVMSRPTRKDWALLGVSLAIAASTKYFGLVLGIIPLVVLVGLLYRRHKVGRALIDLRLLLGLGAFSLGFLIVAAALNVGGFIRPGKFKEDFLFNVNNYSHATSTSGWSGIALNAATLTLLSVGILGTILFACGVLVTWKRSPLGALMLLVPSIALVAYMGVQGWVVTRNMMILEPLTLAVIGVGIAWAVRSASQKGRWFQLAVFFVCALTVLLPAKRTAQAVARSSQTDSRVQAENWIRANVPAGASIGTNEFCSGKSPAAEAGFVPVDDGFMQSRLDYYVMNSYWLGMLSPAYFSNRGVLQESDDSLIHYYHFNDRTLWRDFGSVTVSTNVPQGYRVVKVFHGSGPEIVILGKNR